MESLLTRAETGERGRFVAVQSGWFETIGEREREGGEVEEGWIGGGKAEFRCGKGKAPSGGVRSGVMQI